MTKNQTKPHTVAYFSMEVGLESNMPTYSGGLGVLAGDIVRASADLDIRMVAMTLLHRKGYFKQSLDIKGHQTEESVHWYPEEFLEPLKPRVSIQIEGREVFIQAWRYKAHGVTGHDVPVYFLCTDLPENSEEDRKLTDCLYGGDDKYRLRQEAVLGMGGLAMLRALGYKRFNAYHMNEGHSCLLALALLEELKEGKGLKEVDAEDIEKVRNRCVFTTHTPVAAGHDKFPMEMVRQVLGDEKADFLEAYKIGPTPAMNTTYLALFFSRYINGVSSRHEEISQDMFPKYPIDSITNGVHCFSWTSPPFRRLYDQYMPGWRYDNLYLRYAKRIPLEEVIKAHMEAKKELLSVVKQKTGTQLDCEVLTLGFARRATAYKRSNFLLTDPVRLSRIADQIGPLQIIYAGKAHPLDEKGKKNIKELFQTFKKLNSKVRILYLEDYDMELGRLICSGVDLWLNTPEKPREASGTSGMKAALNGVPSFSVLDGWWIDGHVEGVTGWSIGDLSPESHPEKELKTLYDKLEKTIVPMFYKEQESFAEVMRSAIALNGSFFNGQRMMFQYFKNAYMPKNGY